MFKLIILVAGLGIGFLGGVEWSVHHQDKAAALSADEEQQVLQQTVAIREKIAKIVAKQHGSATGNADVATGSTGTSAVDPDLSELDKKAQDQLDMLKKKLGQ